jgi:hypothetical protein
MEESSETAKGRHKVKAANGAGNGKRHTGYLFATAIIMAKQAKVCRASFLALAVLGWP